jgi:O-antigen/teichoic acid export membrane protein
MENNSLVKNSLYNLLYRGMNILFPLITATYVSRILLASGVGKVSYAQNIAQYFITLAPLGISNYGIREIAIRRNKIDDRNKLFNELFLINAISTLFFSVAYYLLISTIDLFSKNYLLHAIVGLQIVLNLFNVDWFYQGIEEYKYITVRNFVIKLASLFLILFFVRKTNDYVKYAMITCLALGGNNICNIMHLRKHGVTIKFNDLNVVTHLKSIFILLGSVISIELYTLLDTTMVGIWCSDAAVAYYTNSMKLIKMLITFVTAIGGVLLPRLSYYHKMGDEKKSLEIVSKVFSIMLFIFMPCEIGIFLLSDNIIVVLFGKSFVSAGVTLKIASLLICSLGFSNLFGTQVLLTYGKEKLLLATTLIGAVSNIIFNINMIPIWQQNGAAIASVISETLVTFMSLVFARRCMDIRLERKFAYKMVVSNMIMAVIIVFIKGRMENNYLLVVTEVVFASNVYFWINYLMENPVLLDLIDLFKIKVRKNGN